MRVNEKRGRKRGLGGGCLSFFGAMKKSLKNKVPFPAWPSSASRLRNWSAPISWPSRWRASWPPCSWCCRAPSPPCTAGGATRWGSPTARPSARMWWGCPLRRYPPGTIINIFFKYLLRFSYLAEFEPAIAASFTKLRVEC